MKTKIVYSVISDESDIFLEQTIVSMYSLRLYNPDAIIILVVDEQTNSSFSGNRNRIIEYVSEVKVVNIPAELSKKQRSRFLKTSLRQHIVGDYLFIDSDTIITDSLEDIDKQTSQIAAVKDRHLKLSNHFYKNRICECAHIIDWEINTNDEIYYNSGVFYVKDTEFTHDFYKLWHREWVKGHEKGIDIDQPSLGKTNSMLGYVIQELDGVWNCQILTNGIPYLSSAKILHYFNSNVSKELNYPFLLSDVSVYESIKKSGTLTVALKQKISSAKSQFSNEYEIVGGTRLAFQFTSTYTFFWGIYLKSNIIFKALDYPISVLLCIYHKLKFGR